MKVVICPVCNNPVRVYNGARGEFSVPGHLDVIADDGTAILWDINQDPDYLQPTGGKCDYAGTAKVTRMRER